MCPIHLGIGRRQNGICTVSVIFNIRSEGSEQHLHAHLGRIKLVDEFHGRFLVLGLGGHDDMVGAIIQE